ncbi:MAG: winged helix-turn-helix transcriptional regulator [Pseudobacteriovorax sp.]|nr:winged helix-turn-helix transcriptional regulator [Pseudobacteriovorax sp.]
MHIYQEPSISSGGVILDFERYECFSDNRAIRLTLTEFKLLRCLMQRTGFVVTRDQLLREIAPDRKLGDRNVDVHVGYVRRKLGFWGQCLQTVRGLGYKWQNTGTQTNLSQSPLIVDG